MATRDRTESLKEWLLAPGAYDGETPQQRSRRRIVVGLLWLSIPGLGAAAIGSTGTWVVALNILKLLAHIGILAALVWAPRRLALILFSAFGVDLVADVAISVLLGGLVPSGLQILWSLISVLGILVALTVRAATVWCGLFLCGLIVAATSSTWAEPVYELPDLRVNAAVAATGMTLFIFLGLTYFVRQRDQFQQQADDLLHNILPDNIAARLKSDRSMIAEDFAEVSVLFADVVGFTPLSAGMTPPELVGLLNTLFTAFDDYVEELGLEKIKTVGDEYMVAAGVPSPRADHAEALAELALRMRDHVAENTFAGHTLTLRIGINSGPVVAGIIGTRKFSYDMWGDTVNTASRMESEGIPGEIQLSSSTHELLRKRYVCRPRGSIPVKGKGDMEAYLLIGPR